MFNLSNFAGSDFCLGLVFILNFSCAGQLVVSLEATAALRARRRRRRWGEVRVMTERRRRTGVTREGSGVTLHLIISFYANKFKLDLILHLTTYLQCNLNKVWFSHIIIR